MHGPPAMLRWIRLNAQADVERVATRRPATEERRTNGQAYGGFCTGSWPTGWRDGTCSGDQCWSQVTGYQVGQGLVTSTHAVSCNTTMD